MNMIKKVYRGFEPQKYEEIEINKYHVINEVVVDRGPSPYSV